MHVEPRQGHCAKAPSLTYELAGGAVTWDITAADVDAETLLQTANPEDRGEQRDAVDFLREVLEDGSMKQVDVYLAAKRNEISESTLRRAKRKVGVEATKQGFGKDSFWLWRLCPVGGDSLRGETRENPNKTTKAVKDGHPSNVTAFAHEDGQLRLSTEQVTAFDKTLARTPKTTKAVK